MPPDIPAGHRRSRRGPPDAPPGRASIAWSPVSSRSCSPSEGRSHRAPRAPGLGPSTVTVEPTTTGARVRPHSRRPQHRRAKGAPAPAITVVGREVPSARAVRQQVRFIPWSDAAGGRRTKCEPSSIGRADPGAVRPSSRGRTGAEPARRSEGKPPRQGRCGSQNPLATYDPRGTEKRPSQHRSRGQDAPNHHPPPGTCPGPRLASPLGPSTDHALPDAAGSRPATGAWLGAGASLVVSGHTSSLVVASRGLRLELVVAPAAPFFLLRRSRAALAGY